MSGYHVGNNTPGYLPDGEPYHVETWSDALAALKGEIETALDDSMPEVLNTVDEYTDALADINTLQVAAPGIEGGDISYTLPTSNSDHDLGRAYWVARCYEENCAEGNE